MYASGLLAQVASVLRKVEPWLTPEKFEQLRKLGSTLVTHAGEPGIGCKKYPSFIPTAPSPVTRSSRVLVIDVGGTNTKVAERTVNQSGEVAWKLLFESTNETFDVGSETSSFARFASNVVGRIARDLTAVSGEEALGIGLVWSNPAAIELRSDGLPGMSAAVTNRRLGYSKGEFFVADLADGDRIDMPFIRAFESIGRSPRAFVIGNDTTFVFKAIPGASAGVICSTGANPTLVFDGLVYNSELGTSFELPEGILSRPEAALYGPANRATIQTLIAGKWFADNFRAILAHLTDQGMPAFSQFTGDGDRAVPLSNKQLSLLANTRIEEFRDSIDGRVVRDEQVQGLSRLVRELEQRGGMAAGLMVYLSVLNQLQSVPRDADPLEVALDSSMARSFPLYRRVLGETIEKLVPDGRLKVALLTPHGGISVATRGVANTLDSFL